MPGEDEPVRITLRDVYNAVNETNKTVADLSKKFELQALAALQDTATVRDHETRIRVLENELPALAASIDKDKDHEKRIRFLERWAWSIPAAALTLIASAVIALIK
jgi:hypothetical protein